MNIANEVARLRKEIELRENQIVALNKLAELVAEDVTPVAWNGFIDFNNPSREGALALIRKLPGKWQKSPSGEDAKLDYVNREICPGIPVRLYAAEPPPSCKVVEEEVTIPAQPETKVKRMKLVCEPHSVTV